ncbi:MAG: glycosyltransferase family 4 protein [Clostridiales bacterium]|nr:glycosyltransferase family 4 protein [Clostridiales bacterium]
MIYQYIHTWNKGDAVGNEVWAIHAQMDKNNIENRIVKSYPEIPQADTVLFYDVEKNLLPEDLLIFHFAWITPEPIWKKLRNLPCRKIMIYHNITPAEFFEPYDKAMAKSALRARQQLKEGAEFFDAAWADSEYNAEELKAAGYKDVSVLPLVIAFDDYAKTPSRHVMDELSDGYTNILFVGRMVPNKCLEDVIAVFAEYKKQHNPKSRLIFVGNDSMTGYVNKLRHMCRELKIKDVLFKSHCPFADILAYYRSADAFVCMSEHEGFCVPLLEAMYFRVPLIAYEAGAVPLTMGDAGVCVRSKEPSATSSILHALLSDPDMISDMKAKQEERLKVFETPAIMKIFLELLSKQYPVKEGEAKA